MSATPGMRIPRPMGARKAVVTDGEIPGRPAEIGDSNGAFITRVCGMYGLELEDAESGLADAP